MQGGGCACHGKVSEVDIRYLRLFFSSPFFFLPSLTLDPFVHLSIHLVQPIVAMRRQQSSMTEDEASYLHRHILLGKKALRERPTGAKGVRARGFGGRGKAGLGGVVERVERVLGRANEREGKRHGHG